MTIRDEEEIARVKLRIDQFLEKGRELKVKVRENDKALEIAENYLASLLRKSVKEITRVKSITDHLEDILRKNNRPMKAQKLLEKLHEIPGLMMTTLPTVTTTLIRNSKDGKRFEKVAPNTYKLREEKNS